MFFQLAGSTVGGVAAWIAVDGTLVVGAAYWFARAYRARHRLAQTPLVSAFAGARVVLIALLGVALAVVAADIATRGGAAR